MEESHKYYTSNLFTVIKPAVISTKQVQDKFYYDVQNMHLDIPI